MNRTVAFVPPFGSYRVKNPKGIANLFPNPSKDILTLDVSKVKDETENDVECRIINGTGRLMRTFNISAFTRYQLDVSLLPSGTYFLQIIGDQILLTEKFQKI
ncbi:MAG: T9SS type A sorting domain-containing protein [Lewinellaceae bacterium]|nr:T9SS type A sorting domain-containing protein [Lewinellaceae bacterium]